MGQVNFRVVLGLFLLALVFSTLIFIDVRKIVMRYTPNFVLFNAFLYLPMLGWVALMDIFMKKNTLVIATIRNFRKVGSIRKVGWSWGKEYYLFFHIKNFKQKIMVVIETNGSWQLIPQGHEPKEYSFLASVGLTNYSGTLEDILEIAEKGKAGVLAKML